MALIRLSRPLATLLLSADVSQARHCANSHWKDVSMKQRGRDLKTSCRIAVWTAASIYVLATALSASPGLMATLDERINGAEAVVVATVSSIASEWRQNAFGDRLIVSRVELAVHESLKGPATPSLWMEMEGGTLDGLTLRVSSLPLIQHPGERAVFFLDSISRGLYAPHLRGQGILFLDNEDVVRGSSLRLNDIRNRARGLAL